MMYVIYIMFFYRYANHVCVSQTARTNYEDECDLPPIIRTPSIFDEVFLLVRNEQDRSVVKALHPHAAY
jgi:hypothetical protein